MRKKLPIFLFLMSSFVLLNSYRSFVKAQSVELSDFDKALQNYLQSVEVYKKEHADYVLAKSQYERFGTLSSQDAAFEETLQMLVARDQVIIDYLIALKERVLASIGLEENEITETVAKLDQDIGTFSDHKTKLPSAGSLDDLVADSKVAENEYSQIGPDIYEALSMPAYGLVTSYEERLENLHTGLKAKYEEISKEDREAYQLSSRKLQLIDKWLLESELRFVRSEEKRLEAKQLINELSTFKRVNSANYGNIITKVTESRQHLKEAVGFMNEILREIKTTE
jgi:DNA repair exonuclease SbcCD ATPase subunit